MKNMSTSHDEGGIDMNPVNSIQCRWPAAAGAIVSVAFASLFLAACSSEPPSSAELGQAQLSLQGDAGRKVAARMDCGGEVIEKSTTTRGDGLADLMFTELKPGVSCTLDAWVVGEGGVPDAICKAAHTQFIPQAGHLVVVGVTLFCTSAAPAGGNFVVEVVDLDSLSLPIFPNGKWVALCAPVEMEFAVQRGDGGPSGLAYEIALRVDGDDQTLARIEKLGPSAFRVTPLAPGTGSYRELPMVATLTEAGVEAATMRFSLHVDSGTCGSNDASVPDAARVCDAGAPDTTPACRTAADCGEGNACVICDQGACKPAAAGTICRASVGACDVAETCTGTSAACPVDGFAAAGTQCRASAGTCDVAEKCTGISPGCPVDSFVAVGTQCRASSGVCDLAESCTGSAAACPEDTGSPSRTVEDSPNWNCNSYRGDCNSPASPHEVTNCLANNSNANCNASVNGIRILDAWCNRRCDPDPNSTTGATNGNRWFEVLKGWVGQRCSPVQYDAVNTYYCLSSTACVRFQAVTPLCLNFQPEQPVAFQPDDGRGEFALSPGSPNPITRFDWPTARTPWLGLPSKRDGKISSARDLFGSATVLRDGTKAEFGFVALGELDANHDLVIDKNDPDFGKLLLWADANGDRVSTPDELHSLADYGVISIELSMTVNRECDTRHNCAVERSNFTWKDDRGRLQTGQVVDLHPAVR